MRVPLVLSVLLVSALAGCVTGENLVIDEVETDEIPDTVVRYTLDGAAVTAPMSAIGTPWTKLTGFGGGEPTMGITSSGAVFATGGTATIRSLDKGESWEVVYSMGHPADVPTNPAYRSFDPMMWHDPVTDILYTDPMWPPLLCSNLAWTEDDGETWTTNPAVCHPPPMDHQKFFTGLPGPEAPPTAGVLHPTVLYQCYNQLVATECAVSYDGGYTWPIVTPVATRAADGCGGTNGHGATSLTGVVAVPVSACDQLGVGFSEDNGLSWDFVKIPGDMGVQSFDPDLVFDDDGKLFALWRADDHRTYMITTPDLGATWSEPIDVTPPGVKSTFFHTMNLGDDGKLAMAFLGERTHGDDPNDAPTDTLWHLFLVTIEDRYAADPLFTSYQVTTDADPVHVGQICTGGVGCQTGRDLLEFIDSAIHPDGTFYVIYTDSCGEGCAGTGNLTEASKDGRQLGLGRLDGWPLTTVEPVGLVTDAVEGGGPRRL